MKERFFADKEQEYDAASWLTTLQVMQRVGERRSGNKTIPFQYCQLAIHKPDEFYGRMTRSIAHSWYPGDNLEAFFIQQLGAVRHGRIARGLSDAVALLCDDDLAQYVKTRTHFGRLLPIVDELTTYCDDKHMHEVTPDEMGKTLSHTKIDADFYVRMYDPAS